MERLIQLADIFNQLGVSKKSVYRWMKQHPSVGKPFPKPIGRKGRFVVWDEDEVKAWWAENKITVGRHPKQAATITQADRVALEKIWHQALIQAGHEERNDEPFLQILADHRAGKIN